MQVLAYNTTPLKTVTLDTHVQILTVDGLARRRHLPGDPRSGQRFQLDNLLINRRRRRPAANNALVVGTAFAGVGGDAMPALPATDFAVVSRSATPNSGTVRVFPTAAPSSRTSTTRTSATVAPQVYVCGAQRAQPEPAGHGTRSQRAQRRPGRPRRSSAPARRSDPERHDLPRTAASIPARPATRTITRSWPRRPARSISRSTSSSTARACCPAAATWTSQAFDAAGDLIAERRPRRPSRRRSGPWARRPTPACGSRSWPGKATSSVSTAPPPTWSTATTSRHQHGAAGAVRPGTVAERAGRHHHHPRQRLYLGPDGHLQRRRRGATQATGIADISGGAVMGVTLTSNGQRLHLGPDHHLQRRRRAPRRPPPPPASPTRATCRPALPNDDTRPLPVRQRHQRQHAARSTSGWPTACC